MYINTRNITIIMTRIVANLLRLCAVCLRLLLYLWHSNDPEPQVHFFLLDSNLLESKQHWRSKKCIRPGHSVQHIALRSSWHGSWDFYQQYAHIGTPATCSWSPHLRWYVGKRFRQGKGSGRHYSCRQARRNFRWLHSLANAHFVPK